MGVGTWKEFLPVMDKKGARGSEAARPDHKGNIPALAVPWRASRKQGCIPGSPGSTTQAVPAVRSEGAALGVINTSEIFHEQRAP